MQMYIAFLLLVSIEAILFGKNMSVPCKTNGELTLVKKDGTRFFLLLVCIELVIFTGLRGHTVGADTLTYLNALKHYTGISLSEVFTAKLVWPFDFEVGYFLLTKLCGYLYLPPTVFLFIIAVAIYIPTFIYIYKNSSHPYISVLIYFAFGFFSYSLGIFRQFIAIGIVLCALRHIEKKEFIKYLIAVLIAMLFHLTAVIALPLYFLARINWRRNWLIAALIAAQTILILIGRYVIKLAVTLFPSYSGYFDRPENAQGGSYLNLIFLNIVLFSFLFANRKKPQRDLKTNLVSAQLILAVLLQCCAYHMNIFGRVIPYFSMSLMVAIPSIIDEISFKGKMRNLMLKALVILFLCLLIFRELYGNSYVCPFYFFWQMPR